MPAVRNPVARYKRSEPPFNWCEECLTYRDVYYDRVRLEHLCIDCREELVAEVEADPLPGVSLHEMRFTERAPRR